MRIKFKAQLLSNISLISAEHPSNHLQNVILHSFSHLQALLNVKQSENVLRTFIKLHKRGIIKLYIYIRTQSEEREIYTPGTHSIVVSSFVFYNVN